MSNKFRNVRKGDNFYKIVWRGSSEPNPQYINGRDVAEAFNNAGIGHGALAAVDYHAQVFPCQHCDFIADTKTEKRAHKCGKKAA